jgi:hypothetical protein
MSQFIQTEQSISKDIEQGIQATVTNEDREVQATKEFSDMGCDPILEVIQAVSGLRDIKSIYI